VNIVRRAAVLLACISGAVVAVPASAQAAEVTSGCSTYKGVPSVSISYAYCDYAFASSNTWSSGVYSTNHHGAAAVVDTQVNLRIDGDDNVLTAHSWNLPEGKSVLDPYNVASLPTLAFLHQWTHLFPDRSHATARRQLGCLGRGRSIRVLGGLLGSRFEGDPLATVWHCSGLRCSVRAAAKRW